MIYPAINDLLEKVGSRYVLVNVVAKRARELVEGTPVFITTSEKKPVTISTLEVYDGIVSYEPAKHVDDFFEGEEHSLLMEEETEFIEPTLTDPPGEFVQDEGENEE